VLNKIIVGVLASDNGGYANMVQACRDTCYSKSHIPENVSVFYIYGHRQGITTPEKSKVIGDCFYHNHPESRRNIIYKTIAFFEYCCDNFEFDYIYRPNCGSYVNLSILNGIANELPSKNLYFGTKSNNENLPAYASGAGFMISRDLAEKIVSNKDKIVYPHDGQCFVMDDVSIGAALTEVFNVEITDAPRVDVTYEALKSVAFVFEPSCYHYYFRHTIDPRCFHEVHKYFKIRHPEQPSLGGE